MATKHKSRPKPRRAPFESLRVRKQTKDRVELIAHEHRLKLADAADVLSLAWDVLTPVQRADVIRRPAEAIAS